MQVEDAAAEHAGLRVMWLHARRYVKPMNHGRAPIGTLGSLALVKAPVGPVGVAVAVVVHPGGFHNANRGDNDN